MNYVSLSVSKSVTFLRKPFILQLIHFTDLPREAAKKGVFFSGPGGKGPTTKDKRTFF